MPLGRRLNEMKAEVLACREHNYRVWFESVERPTISIEKYYNDFVTNLEDQIMKYPFFDKYKIRLIGDESITVAIVDRLILNGVRNFELDPHGKLLVEGVEYHEGLFIEIPYLTITVCYPFDKPMFAKPI